MPVRICFVCLGNICRSPTAEATMRQLIVRAGLESQVELDSAGTGDWHIGHPPDRRAKAAGKRRGIDLQGRARRVEAGDFERFDYLIAMDRSNLEELARLSPNDEAREKVFLLRSFEPGAPPEAEVPDPYYGEGDGFEKVLDICDAACRGLLEHIREHHRL